jgi:hypothetical protein
MAKPTPPLQKDQKTAREESLARALRDNLRRRKDQARARTAHEATDQEDAPKPPPVDKRD